MLRTLRSSDTVVTADFGGFCPYWAVQNGEVIVADTADEIICSLPHDRREIDPVACAEVLWFNYVLGSRTLVRGIQRMPWRATLHADGTVHRRPPIPHGDAESGPEKVALRLRALLEEELYSAVQGHRKIYLLLTGGLDSRVVAGILKSLEPQLRTTITCVTWGRDDSRDVAYASKIASWYEWAFVRVPYDHELVWSNIIRGAVWGGSEVSGIHLHGMEWFRSVGPDALVLAASFGDSIGRAEFSSRHLSDIRREPLRRTGHLIHPSLLNSSLSAAERDRESAWEGEHSPWEWAYSELDMQENYMRRMICHAMDYIRQFCRLYQAFTDVALVSYMWSLSPGSRTDDVYKILLRDLDMRLYTLPWARSGTAFDATRETDSRLRRDYHDIGAWLRGELRSRLEELYFSASSGSGLFYGPALRRVWNGWMREPAESLGGGELVAKVCSIEMARRHFQMRSPRRPTLFWDDISGPLRRAAAFSRRVLDRT